MKLIAKLLIAPLMAVGLAAMPTAPAQAAADPAPVYVKWWGWKGVHFTYRLTRAAKILNREVYDGCGGYPAVWEPPRELRISHPMAPSNYELKDLHVKYMGGYTPNIHVPHGIHPGMRTKRALRLLGSDRIKVKNEWRNAWIEVRPNGRTLLIFGSQGKVQMAAVVVRKKFAVRLANNPGC
jgi:hypothetical protein